jgi:hypothetical protein
VLCKIEQPFWIFLVSQGCSRNVEEPPAEGLGRTWGGSLCCCKHADGVGSQAASAGRDENQGCLALLGPAWLLSSVLVLFVLSVLVSSSPFPAPPNKINKLTNKIQKDKVKSSSTVSGNFSLIMPYPSVFLGLQHVANNFCFPSRLPI